jgi:outer membrane PBP1 activator LpoA protein
MPGTAIEGATGALSLDDFGQVQRQPGWGRFHNGRVRPASAPEGLLPLNDAGAALR